MNTQGTGYIGQNAEVKEFENGNKVATFSVARNSSYKNSKGEKVEKTTWYTCKEYRKDFSQKYLEDILTKGKLVEVVGTWEVDEYEEEGNKKFAHYLKVNKVTPFSPSAKE